MTSLVHIFIKFVFSPFQSRSKAEDPEQLKLKEKAKAMKQMEMDIAQHREANETALAAIGSYKKKRKVEPEPAQVRRGGDMLREGWGQNNYR